MPRSRDGISGCWCDQIAGSPRQPITTSLRRTKISSHDRGAAGSPGNPVIEKSNHLVAETRGDAVTRSRPDWATASQCCRIIGWQHHPVAASHDREVTA
jgi:hypothetical protein